MQEEIIKCPVDDCHEVLEVDDYQGYSIYTCDIHGEVEPTDLEDE